MWTWDGLALIRRGSDIYVNEPHVSGGVPILSKTDEGVRYHEHDFLGATLWSTDTKGNLVRDYQDTTIFGEGSIQKDRSARYRQALRRRLAGVCIPISQLRRLHRPLALIRPCGLSRRNKQPVLCGDTYLWLGSFGLLDC